VILASFSSVLGVIVGIVVVLAVVLFVGGYVANARRHKTMDERLRAQIEVADSALADARAQDRGWDRATIEAAARAALAPREVRELQLIRVVDRPGTDADEAVFRAVSADGAESTVTLGRRDGAWVAV
jgi:uncharacterized membrane protein YccC